jgi:hypothetical protein
MNTRGIGSCVLCALACGCAFAAAAEAGDDCLDAIASSTAVAALAPASSSDPQMSGVDLAVCTLDPYCVFPFAGVHR